MRLVFIGALIFTLFNFKINAQHTDTFVIKYEKKINVHKRFEDSKGENWYEEFIKRTPKYYVEEHLLIALENASVYSKIVDENAAPNRNNGLWGYSSDENKVYNNFLTQKTIATREVFEDKFLIQDSLKKLNWKLTTDTRVIEGYNCRKATTVIFDSIEVIAFYAEELVMSTGPEFFQGLPGAILGLAIPDIHLTIFATQVKRTVSKEQFEKFSVPTEGKKSNYEKVHDLLQKAVGKWGKYGKFNMWLMQL